MPRLYPRERRSTRSGRARATSSASTCCGRWRASPQRARGLLRRGRRGRRGRAAARRRASAALRRRARRTPRRSRPAPGAWSSGWRWRSRARCSSATATRRSPTPSAPRAWPATGAGPSAPCRPAPTSARIIERHAPGVWRRRSQPSLVQPPDDRLGQPDGVREGAVVDVLGDVGRPVIVGGLLEVGARAERRRTHTRRRAASRRRWRFVAVGSGTARSRAPRRSRRSGRASGPGTRAFGSSPPPEGPAGAASPVCRGSMKKVLSRGRSAKWRSAKACIPSQMRLLRAWRRASRRTLLAGRSESARRSPAAPPRRWRCRWPREPFRAGRCRRAPPPRGRRAPSRP